MKLKVNSFAQRDSRWGQILLGYNSNQLYNIANYGCLITCLAAYLSSLGGSDTPATVNQKLKDNAGFALGGGNFVWTKSIVLGFTQTYLSPYYDGPVTTQGLAKIKTLLDQGYPLLCEVDFNPATVGEEMHFVLLCGYDIEGDKIYAMDPWQGKVVDLDVYGGPNRAILQFRAYDKILAKLDVETPTSPELEACLKQHTELVDKCNQKDQLIAELSNDTDGLKAQITTYENNLKAIASTLNIPNEMPKILGEITTLISQGDQLRQTLKDNETLKSSEATCQGNLSKEIERADNALIQNKAQTEALAEATDTIKKLNLELDQSHQLYEPLLNIFGFVICKKRGDINV